MIHLASDPELPLSGHWGGGGGEGGKEKEIKKTWQFIQGVWMGPCVAGRIQEMGIMPVVLYF